MPHTRGWGYAVATILAAAAIALSTSAAWAADLTLAAGTACTFNLKISGISDNNIVRHQTNGLTISGGTGSALTFTNLDNGKSVSLPSNGVASVVRTNLDGSFVEQLTGNNVVILFPTDTPAGPSTTLIVGRVVIAVDALGNFTEQSVSGKQTDICALLT